MAKTDDKLTEIPVELIDPSPYRPRQWEDPEAMDMMRQTIRNGGLVQPIIVRPKGERYEVVAGHCRLQAHRDVGEEKIRAIVREMTDEEAMRAALVSDMHTQRLTCVEIGERLSEVSVTGPPGGGEWAGQGARTDTFSDSEKVSPTFGGYAEALFGLPRPRISECLGVAEHLAPEVKQMVVERELPDSAALSLAKLHDADDQTRMASAAVRHGWTGAKVERKVRRWRQERELKDERERRAAEGETVELPEGYEVVTGDFREVLGELPEASVDLLFTDPPYAKEYTPLFGDLARLGARVLKPGGSLVSYAGHLQAFDAVALMREHLQLWWLIAAQQSGPDARMVGRDVFVLWKPLLWFVRGREREGGWVEDLRVSPSRCKEHHDWEQNPSVAEYYIGRLTEPGDLVLDPMCGSGTTLVAALKLGRRAFGVDVDEDAANIARQRVAEAARQGEG